jgi:hypothetical protein
MSQLNRIPFHLKTLTLFSAALLTAGTTAHAQNESAQISSSEGPSLSHESMDGTAENHRAIVIEAHIDAKSEQQPISRQKRIRVLRSSENFDDAEVGALVERLVKKYGSSEHSDAQVELETIEEIELSDIDTNIFITRGEDLDNEHGDVVHFMARADGPGMPPKRGFRGREKRPHRVALSEQAAQCVLSRITKIQTDIAAHLLRDACAAAYPFDDE